MSEVIQFRPHGVCCQIMQLEIENDTVKDAQFFGGCSGNLRGIRSLIRGMKIDDVIAKLEGIPCGDKATSCPDQLSVCLKEYKKQTLQKA